MLEDGILRNKKRYKKKDNIIKYTSSEECLFCLNTFNNEDYVCGNHGKYIHNNKYHLKCIKYYFTKHNSCPLCRKQCKLINNKILDCHNNDNYDNYDNYENSEENIINIQDDTINRIRIYTLYYEVSLQHNQVIFCLVLLIIVIKIIKDLIDYIRNSISYLSINEGILDDLN